MNVVCFIIALAYKSQRGNGDVETSTWTGSDSDLQRGCHEVFYVTSLRIKLHLTRASRYREVSRCIEMSRSFFFLAIISETYLPCKIEKIAIR